MAETIEPTAEEHRAPEHLYTRTLGELYVTQGSLSRALKVFHYLHERDPVDLEIARRVEVLEGRILTELESKKEVQRLGYDVVNQGSLGSDAGTPRVDANECQGEAESERPLIGDYFRGLLTWESRESS